MRREDCIEDLSAAAADMSSMARTIELNTALASAVNDPHEADQLAWAGELRYSAGTCLAAINHLNGVSPE
ncbi:hypothetical protein ACFOHU_08070 [Ottowia pentelensis]|uniref:Uncharacterized protein n=1 Tax=Ottowia pentelensis TaxID=511108 RepID=A0ABV6PTJ8_9BURK